VFEPRTSINPTSGAIGPGLAFALGAATANGRKTLLIQGDGGMMLSVGELASLVQQRANVVVCVFNDRGYGILRSVQRLRLQRRSGVDLATPNFVELGQAFGMPAVRVATLDAFRSAMAVEAQRSGPGLIEIDMDAFVPADLGALGSD
jgi:acetolactate synthase-1/2/3 large subunit